MLTPVVWYRSRRLWILFVDSVVSIATILLTASLSPDSLKMVLAILGILQPAVISVIAAFTVDDTVQAKYNAQLISAGKITLPVK